MQLKTFAITAAAAVLCMVPGLYATKAFFNPNPPPAVYYYNNPANTNPNTGYVSPTYVPPTYVPPTYNPGYNYNYNPYLNNSYYYNTQPQQPQYYFDQNGNMLWIGPNKTH